MHKNIEAVYSKVDKIDYAEGLVSYQRYQETMLSFAQFYGFTLKQTTAAFVALSPNNDYIGNLRSLASVLDGLNNRIPTERITVATYNACKRRAVAFATGTDFLDVTKGPKTRAFYQNILDPTNMTPVTVDGHMTAVYIGKRITMKEAVYLKIPYESIAFAIRQAAFEVGLVPNQLQAMLWFTWKRIHNIVYNGQLHLFAIDNQWRTAICPTNIKPFNSKREV